jgi:SpoVK/Ycf46/Vps4 family AAA+-type ATPase
MFFVDLPDALERAQIWDIVIKRHGRRPTDYDTVVLVRACEQFTGAEIEAVFIDALHEAFAEGAEPCVRKHILPAMTNTVPLATSWTVRSAPCATGPKAAPVKPQAEPHPPATAGGWRS